ncbi:MAG: glucose-6-phosphate dehydrogenase [Microbacterium sp.]|uniref:glucose-6-phosphate dehydrogenase n=1 Tax=Microbacterium sp. TaxID=51671 RepID=UPI0039E632D7
MRVVTASDWRDGLPFETPLILESVLPGEPARCSSCGGESAPLPRAELWAVKHRHPRHHDGFVRFYCAAHLPAVKPPEPAARKRASAPSRPRAPKRVVVEKPSVFCPDCFVEVPATGVCGMCGQPV